MSGAEFNVQNYIGSRLGLSAAWTFDLLIFLTEISRAVVYFNDKFLSHSFRTSSVFQSGLGHQSKFKIVQAKKSLP